VRLVLIALLAIACTQPRSARCKQVCAREYECITSAPSSVPFDEKECIAACAVLEADQDNAAKVQKHEDCVTKALSCGDVVRCDSR